MPCRVHAGYYSGNMRTADHIHMGSILPTCGTACRLLCFSAEPSRWGPKQTLSRDSGHFTDKSSLRDQGPRQRSGLSALSALKRVHSVLSRPLQSHARAGIRHRGSGGKATARAPGEEHLPSQWNLPHSASVAPGALGLLSHMI
jgi:hypothetical protein